MSLARVLRILRKDLALGPRSPIFLWAIVLPVILTVLFQFAFGSLFTPQPRLAIVDGGDSEITEEIEGMEGIDLVMVDDEAELREMVEADDVDAGLVLPKGFDEAVRSGERPELRFHIGGESLASNRIILSVTTVDLIRQVEGSTAPVEVEIVDFGEEGMPIATRLVPVIMMYALIIAGVFVPGSSLVDEKEKGTISALLVTPVRTSEILVAKGLLGLLLASVLSVMTLVLNDALGARPLHTVAVVAVAALMSSVLGMLAGVVSKNSAMLFTLIKGAGIFLLGPVIFYLFPDWPQWIAKLLPLYWVIEPVWQVSIMGEPIGEVAFELAVAGAIIAALVPLVAWLARRMERSLASE